MKRGNSSLTVGRIAARARMDAERQLAKHEEAIPQLRALIKALSAATSEAPKRSARRKPSKRRASAATPSETQAA